MKTLLSSICALVICAAFYAPTQAAVHHRSTHNGGDTVNAPTPNRKAPPLKEMGGQEVTTEFFKLIIPNGWSMPVPPKKSPNGDGVSCVFGRMTQDPAISITVMKTPGTAKQIGEATIANMKKGRMKVSPLEEKDGFWHATMTQGKGKGELWFGSADGMASVTIITGSDVAKANELLSAIQPKAKGLFPTSAE